MKTDEELAGIVKELTGIVMKKKDKTPFEVYSSEIFPNGESIMCSIHSSFHKENERTHNCIGCNFSDYTELLQSVLKKHSDADSPLEVFSSTILYAYILVERFEEIFKIIKLDDSYKLKYFQVFGKIKRWTNFLKHPKAFILVHHPEYTFELCETLEQSKLLMLHALCQQAASDLITFIDQEFVDTYYSSDSNNGKLYSILTNKKNVFVLFPNLTELISDFCIAQKKFIEIISKNEVYREILDGKTTLKDYFGISTEKNETKL